MRQSEIPKLAITPFEDVENYLKDQERKLQKGMQKILELKQSLQGDHLSMEKKATELENADLLLKEYTENLRHKKFQVRARQK